jgi:hypothetical protein
MLPGAIASPSVPSDRRCASGLDDDDGLTGLDGADHLLDSTRRPADFDRPSVVSVGALTNINMRVAIPSD